MRSTSRFAWLAMAVTLAFVACNGPTREWTPADHDHDPASAAQAAGQPQAPMPAGSRGGGMTAEQRAQLVETAWARQCASCHGPDGKGDGPQGPLVGARDLTAPAFQASVTDEQLAKSIKSGKGKMPAFDIPDIAIKALVGRVRAHRGQ